MQHRETLNGLLKRNAPSTTWLHGLIAEHFFGDPLLVDLPDPGGSVAAYADALVEALERRGLLNEKFLSYLQQELPHEQDSINDIRRCLSLAMRVEEIVSFDCLMDNWVYQDVAELFVDGPREEPVGFVSVGEDELVWRPVSGAAVALECLLTVLSGIVLRDRFLVEEKHIDAWVHEASPVLGLHAGGMLCPYAEPAELGKVRSPLYRQLFHTPSLQALHARNVAATRTTGRAANGYETSVTWGSVGYLARSAVLGITYSGHPARRNFLAQTPFVESLRDAAAWTIGELDAARIKYLAEMQGDMSVVLGFVVPPLLVQIIEDSRTADDLIPVALQFREKYRDLRRWLGWFQKALTERDQERILECSEAVQAIKTVLCGPRAHGSLRHDVASRAIHSLPGLHRPAAVILERLGRTPPGEAAIDRLLELFEIAGTILETPVLTHLRMSVMKAAV